MLGLRDQGTATVGFILSVAAKTIFGALIASLLV
jgi:hypothetical protein